MMDKTQTRTRKWIDFLFMDVTSWGREVHFGKMIVWLLCVTVALSVVLVIWLEATLAPTNCELRAEAANLQAGMGVEEAYRLAELVCRDD